MSSKQLVRDYSRFRQAGWHAATALRAVRTCAEFAALESLGLVRLVASEEVESYFDVFGEPEGYTDGNGKRVSAEAERQELVRSFERDGVWHVGSQWRTSEADEWRPAAGVGMCAGYSNPLSPVENCYVPDLMRSAVDAVRAQEHATNL